MRLPNVNDLMAAPSAEEIEQLAELYRHPGYSAFFNVLKRTCLQMENSLINIPVNEQARVLAEHRKVQAAWQLVLELTSTVQAAAQEWERRSAPAAEAAHWSRADLDQDNLLNPLRGEESL